MEESCKRLAAGRVEWHEGLEKKYRTVKTVKNLES